MDTNQTPPVAPMPPFTSPAPPVRPPVNPPVKETPLPYTE